VAAAFDTLALDLVDVSAFLDMDGGEKFLFLGDGPLETVDTAFEVGLALILELVVLGVVRELLGLKGQIGHHALLKEPQIVLGGFAPRQGMLLGVAVLLLRVNLVRG
jgi:hypothetical protein